MSLSVLDLFSIGIGPSSSHTMGPMRAALRYLSEIDQAVLNKADRIQVHLYGSLALTGRGHGTDKALILGLFGFRPELIQQHQIDSTLQQSRQAKKLILEQSGHVLNFDPAIDIVFHMAENLPLHANGMRFELHDNAGTVMDQQVYYSVGGGFICAENDMGEDQSHPISARDAKCFPFPFKTAAELLAHAKVSNKSIAEIVLANEACFRPEEKTKAALLNIWSVMKDSIDAGIAHPGILPGGLNVKRRAPGLQQKLLERATPIHDLNWLNLYALAVNEENAGGGRVVTAPTNGAAGVIPAVLQYYLTTEQPEYPDEQIVTYLLTAGAMGILYKLGASISAAEVGCQGEVGVASSMAAASYCAVMGGTVSQVDGAAEIGMEHHLGLTCDPVGGLVQVPCIERNTMGAVQAINAAKLTLMEDHVKVLTLDQVINAMRETGRDMMVQYKETALGGLAKQMDITRNLPEC